MQPMTGKHRPLPAENGVHSNSPDQLPNNGASPLGLGSPPTELNNGAPGLPPASAAPLEEVSPNVPLLSLSQFPSPGTKYLGSPNAARRLSFSIGGGGGGGGATTSAGFSVPDFPTSFNTNTLEEGISPLLARIAPPPGCPWVAEFGELADLSKLGSLPHEDDILLRYFVDNKEVEIAVGDASVMHPQQLQNGVHQQQDHYLQQPRSYFQLQPQQQESSHLLWVPTQQQHSFDPGFSGAPTPLSTHHPADGQLTNQQQHQGYQIHSTMQQGGGSSSSPFYLGNVAPGSTAAAASTPRLKRRAETEQLGTAMPPSSVASRGHISKHQRQNGNYSGLFTHPVEYTPPYQYHPQQQRSTKNNNTSSRTSNRNHAHHLSALPDDFDSEDPGANTGKTYRGVSRHRLTQRWEASLWLNGRQLYLGGFDAQIDAAKAYDLAALACKGPDAIINLPAEEYDDQLKEIAGFSREEVVAYVRRRSAAFSRGKSKYRGVSGHNGRWEARIGSFNGRKNVSFGVFETEECAGRQYDRALILEKGRSAKTNFPLRDYEAEVEVYKTHMARTCGQLPRGSPAVMREVEAYTLPRNREATPDEKKRSAIIYGESLRQALEGR